MVINKGEGASVSNFLFILILILHTHPVHIHARTPMGDGWAYGTGDHGKCDTVGSDMDHDQSDPPGGSNLLYISGYTTSQSFIKDQILDECTPWQVPFLLKTNGIGGIVTKKFYPFYAQARGDKWRFDDATKIIVSDRKHCAAAG